MVKAYLRRPNALKKLMYIPFLVGVTLASPLSFAALTPLSSDELSAAQGAGTGVQISLDASINGTMNPATGTWTPASTCVTAAGLPGSASAFCRFGVQENNVYNWLLLKDFNGYINVPQLILYGSTVTPTSGLQSAIAIQINLPSPTSKTSQININNLYYTFALAVSPCYSNSGGTVSSSCSSTTLPTAAQNQTTYYDASVFQSTSATGQYYSPVDAGKETGILGVRMSGNLNVGGTLYVFSK